MATKNLKVKVSGVDLIYTGVNKIAVSDSDDNVVYLYAIDDTTALASDVISGKYFYAADGTYTLGTASSGGSSEPALSTPIATISQVLAGYNFNDNSGTAKVGTMVDYSGRTQQGRTPELLSTGLYLYNPYDGYYTTANKLYILNADVATLAGITSDKIVSGNTIFGVSGTATIINLTTQTITANGTYTPASPYNGYSQVTVNVASGSTEPTLSSPIATAAKVLTGYNFNDNSGTAQVGTMTNNGAISQTLYVGNLSYTVPSGYHNGSGSVSVSIQTKTGTPTTSSQLISPDSGKLLSGVTIAAISVQSKTVKSTTSSQTISPDSGYYINSITVSPISLQSKTTTVNGTISPDSGYDGLSSVIVNVPSTGTDISATTAVAADVLASKIFYLANGTQATGTIISYGATTFIGSCTNSQNGLSVKIPYTGYWTTNDSNFILYNSSIATAGGVTATKIVNGNTLFGVVGTAPQVLYGSTAPASSVGNDGDLYVVI
jgi:hypothetical protein